MENNLSPVYDRESESCLSQMAHQEEVLSNRFSGVKFVLVVLSTNGIVFDREALRQKLVLAYPDAVVFFRNTGGKPIGPVSPEKIDLLIDLTGPGERQAWCYAKKLRRISRMAVGRNAGLFRKKIYDRIYDEKVNDKVIPKGILERERFVQKKIFNLSGVAFLPSGDTPTDRGKTIALGLPGMQRL